MTNIIEYVKRYHSNGWVTVPVETKNKRPLLVNWQKRTLADVKPETEFLNGVNVGVVLGDSSGGLVDIDLDCPEALLIAARYLPETNLIFGRASTPKSHWIYKVENCGEGRKYVYEGTLLEYRTNGGQTVFPPSIHPSGEQYAFDIEGMPGDVKRETLEKAVRTIAAACLIARCWHKSQRHETALALAGALLRAEWNADEVSYFIESVCIAAGDDEIEDRIACVNSTLEGIQANIPVTGLPTLAELIDKNATNRVMEWLGISKKIDRKPTEPLTQLSKERFSDSNQSDIFAREYQDIARFCHEHGCWFIWDGKHWTPDICDSIIMLTEKCIKTQVNICCKTNQTDDLNKALACLSAGRLRSITDLAKSKMSIRKMDFNPDPWLFNCQNGVIDLRTGELKAHSPEFYQCFMANVEFKPEADCPLFKKFIHQIMMKKEDMVGYLQRAAGYTLTGNTSEQCFFLLMGDGKNGKSTLLELMRYIWGNYSRTVAAKTLMVSSIDQTPSDIAQLEGKRFAPCSETSNMQKLNEARIKTLTGGDEVEARRRYADEYTYTPHFKLWVATNSVPKIRGTDEGIWRRIHKIPFDFRPREEEVDKCLLDKLKAEASGILNWLLAGALQWQEMKGLNPPEEIKRATEAYREEMDSVRDFISDCLRKAPGDSIQNAGMYDFFKQWFYNNMGDQSVPGQKELTQRLREAGFKQKGGRTRKWVDVQFMPDEVDDLTDAELEAEFNQPAGRISEVYVTDDSLPF